MFICLKKTHRVTFFFFFFFFFFSSPLPSTIIWFSQEILLFDYYFTIPFLLFRLHSACTSKKTTAYSLFLHLGLEKSPGLWGSTSSMIIQSVKNKKKREGDCIYCNPVELRGAG